MPRLLAAVPLVTALAALVACDTDDGRQLREPTADQRAAMTTTTTSSSVPSVPPDAIGGSTTTAIVAPVPFSLTAPWGAGGAIDARFTCDGENLAPALNWTAPPAGTVELALLVTDDDAGGFVHWAVAAIAPTAGQVAEGGLIAGGIQGRNDAGTSGWSGPCPPSGTHTYRFSLYALDQQAELPDDFAGAELVTLAGTSALAFAETTGTYTRP